MPVRTYDEVRAASHSTTTSRALAPLPQPCAAAPALASPAQERAFIEQVSNVQFTVKTGFVPNMRVPGTFYVNADLQQLLFDELAQHVERGEVRR